MKFPHLLSTLFILSILSPAAAPAQPNATLRGRAAALRGTQPLPRSILDPYRCIGGSTNLVTPDRWCEFSGRIIGIARTGIHLSGFYHNTASPLDLTERDFFVSNFPYHVANDDQISGYYALPAGLYTYTTVLGSIRTIHRLDYGTPWAVPQAPPPTALDQAKSAEALQRKIAAGQAAALKFHLQRARAGDQISQRRLAELYQARGDTNAAAFWRAAAATNAPAK
jgi:hypothetical protein